MHAANAASLTLALRLMQAVGGRPTSGWSRPCYFGTLLPIVGALQDAL